MIPAPFEYLRASSVEHALGLLRAHGEDARPLAGGQSLIPLLKLRVAAPRYLIDIGRLQALSYVRADTDTICIGGLTTHAEVEHSALLRSRLPLLASAASCIGDVQVRNRGTIGGSLAHAHPAADLPAVILATQAELVVQSPGGRRTIPARDFFTSMFTTALRPDELLVETRFRPLPDGAGCAYVRAEDHASHFAVVGVAAIVGVDADRTCRHVRVALTGLTATPFRATAFEAALLDQRLEQAAVEEAARRTIGAAEPLSDLFASGEYRIHLAQVYAARAVLQAAPR